MLPDNWFYYPVITHSAKEVRTIAPTSPFFRFEVAVLFPSRIFILSAHVLDLKVNK